MLDLTPDLVRRLKWPAPWAASSRRCPIGSPCAPRDPEPRRVPGALAPRRDRPPRQPWPHPAAGAGGASRRPPHLRVRVRQPGQLRSRSRPRALQPVPAGSAGERHLWRSRRRGAKLLQALHRSPADNSFERDRESWLAPALLLLDDFGLRKLTAQRSSDFCDVLVNACFTGIVRNGSLRHRRP